MQGKKQTIRNSGDLCCAWKRTPGMGMSKADSRENIELFLRRNEGLSLVCEDGETLVGSVLCGHDGRRGFMYHLAVHPAYRNKGIGGELVKRACTA